MQYIAFLRAINTTGRFVRMERLCRAFKRMGFSNVETHIQSGNVAFEADSTTVAALERQIEDGLQNLLGFPVPTFVRTGPELMGILAHCPFVEPAALNQDSTLYVIFLHEEPAPDCQQALLAESSQINQLNIYKNQIFWLYNRSVGESSFSNATIEKILRVPATLRNISTIKKIAEKYR
jgi:uncharacterized protein (DUF1697 family)